MIMFVVAFVVVVGVMTGARVIRVEIMGGEVDGGRGRGRGL